jgi:hypothetical protein
VRLNKRQLAMREADYQTLIARISAPRETTMSLDASKPSWSSVIPQPLNWPGKSMAWPAVPICFVAAALARPHRGGNAFPPAQLRDVLLAAQSFQHNADLLFGRILLPRRSANVADKLLGVPAVETDFRLIFAPWRLR